MKTILRLLLISALATLSLSSMAFGQTPAEVRVKLTFAENKSVYRIGEPIRLVLEFTTDREGFQVEIIPDKWQVTSDTFSVSPTKGVTPWLDEYFRGQRYPRDVFSSQKLSQAPTRVELLLNDSLRFDEPGKYSVQVTTRRVTAVGKANEFGTPIPLTTNPVTFEVQTMSESEERKEVERLAALLESARGWEPEAKLAEELSFLTGDVAAREKVRRFLNTEGRSGNYNQHINFGLFITRNRALVLRLLETAMRDPNTPVDWSLMSAVGKLRVLRDYPGTNFPASTTMATLSPTGDPRLEQIQQTYVAELAASLGKRAGKAQTTTAATILMHLPKDTEATDPVLTAVRSVLLEQFDSLHPFTQEYLLRGYWDRLKDASLATSLEKMLANRGASNKSNHEMALKALLELAPEKAKQYIIAEIRDPRSLVDYEVLQSLPDRSLPETDPALAEQIRTLASSKVNFDRIRLNHKASLAARYATENIYPDLMEIYRNGEATLALDVRAALLAYLARHNEMEALPLIEQTVNQVPVEQYSNFLPQLTRLYYSDGIDAILRKRLEGDEPQIVSTAAYLISLHGPPGDQKVLEARLERWLKEWRHRPAEADATLQGVAERELIMALGQGKSWKLSSERYKELQQQCVTKICRQTFQLK